MDPQTPEDEENLRKWKFFQGVDGIPFRTEHDSAPFYKGDDPYHRQPKMVADMHVKQFDLGDDAQLQEYEGILDLCAKGKGYLSQQDVQFDEKIQGWRVLIIWGTFYLEDPVEANGRDGKDKKTFS